eukprot:CAMPEP_0203675788 /NCGR_PEP_ID=MMETSP0090-20130426/22149_1 /ASSEMBLY_ACC=CAM_ASM_001088 /TAXON_ID=426623 /ORGANISM="Chaetoceros affinis, Strain CCMP159" /LENGTH=275 /DNA_ID=CAMNT_0050542117 /DNA_START=42 /DNA_END=866 /DNA_ORIENTATION=-
MSSNCGVDASFVNDERSLSGQQANETRDPTVASSGTGTRTPERYDVDSMMNEHHKSNCTMSLKKAGSAKRKQKCNVSENNLENTVKRDGTKPGLRCSERKQKRMQAAVSSKNQQNAETSSPRNANSCGETVKEDIAQEEKHEHKHKSAATVTDLHEKNIKDHHVESWERMYRKLKDYKKKYGNCEVPTGWKEDTKLSAWIASLRKSHKRKLRNKPFQHCFLTDARMKKLNEIGFTWSIKRSPKWDEMFEELVKFKDDHGHCLVPQRYEQNSSLGW